MWETARVVEVTTQEHAKNLAETLETRLRQEFADREVRVGLSGDFREIQIRVDDWTETRFVSFFDSDTIEQIVDIVRSALKR